MKMEKHLTYKTYDIGLASALITSEANLLYLDKTDYKKIGFIFEYSFDLEEKVNLYWKNKLGVDARTFFENTKMLKTRIYSER
jgi:hypothetical protein